nr:hypothetical protein BHI3_29180 [Bacteriovorax sp. HI3]
MTTKLLGTIAALSLVTTSAFAGEPARNKALDKMMYTINPEITLAGPVFRDQGDAASKNKYGSDLVRLILKEADRQGQKYLEAGDTQAYYAILTMALTVPMQEGLYIQYRGVEGSDVCRTEVNNGDLVKKAGETNYSLFNQYFKTAEKPFLPNCEDIKTDKLTQIIRGGDGTDLSLMQVSIRWHFDDFLANKKYESVQSTLEYGIGHLMKGFNPVYRNVTEYKCIAESGLFKKKKVSYINLIRGVWAGQYNSGSISKTCRFDDSSSPYKHHDKGFEKNLNKILDFKGTLSVDMVADFKLEQEVADAVMEVTSNLKAATNNRTALDKILK